MKILCFIGIMLFVNSCTSQENIKSTSVNGMIVNWYYIAENIRFEMNAPANGWVAIGFNTTSKIKNTYLLMGNINNNIPNVQEHFVLEAGNYKSFKSLKITTNVIEVNGLEDKNGTKLSFSIPIRDIAPYKPNLTKGKEYILLLAYSQEDDFQHHSIMRTSKKIKL